MRIIKFIALCTLLTASVVIAAQKRLQPKLAISPPRLELYPEQSRKGESITVLNLGNMPMKVQVSAQNWDLDELNQFRALPSTEQSLDQWLIVNPVRLVIPANSQQTVRLAVRPRVKPEAGEHRAMVFFRQMPEENQESQVNFNVGVPIYAYFGEVERKAKIHSVSFNQQNHAVIMDVSNMGNAYVRPRGVYAIMHKKDLDKGTELLELLDLDNEIIDDERIIDSGKFASQPVFAPERRQLNHQILLKEKIKEPYVIGIKVDIAGQIITKTFDISIR